MSWKTSLGKVTDRLTKSDETLESDDLQATMALLKNADLDVAVQFVNFR